VNKIHIRLAAVYTKYTDALAVLWNTGLRRTLKVVTEGANAAYEGLVQEFVKLASKALTVRSTLHSRQLQVLSRLFVFAALRSLQKT
jgi:hypothetical protein